MHAADLLQRRGLYAAELFAEQVNVEPRVAGTAVSLSPFMVLFAIFFWGILWGIVDAFIGVPILIALCAVCARHAPSRPIAVLLSADRGTGSACE